MNRSDKEDFRYDRLTRVIAMDPEVRRNALRARISLLATAGGFLVVGVLQWDVDTASVSRPEFFRNPTPHEAHFLALRHGVGGDEALASDWEREALLAIDAPLRVASAYQEVGFFPPAAPQALGLQIHIPRGQRLRLDLAEEGEDSLELFVDVFRSAPDPLRRPAWVEGGVISAGEWTFDCDRTGSYVIRLQPEILKGGRYRLVIRVGAPWRFPVAGAGEEDIGSFFGDPRDGGTRLHYGIDIFAPRGTPVLAATDGYAHMVDTTGNGGIMIWQSESGGRHSAYYAHLDRLLVQRGQGFRQGDTIGLVGNTGNARTTPPHLHFGAFVRGGGPVDPMNLVLPIPPSPDPVLADAGALGAEGRASGTGVRLLRSPSAGSPVLGELPEGAPFLILGGTGRWYRVLLPGGDRGWVQSRHVEFSPPSVP